jgi:hypothetical protein
MKTVQLSLLPQMRNGILSTTLLLLSFLWWNLTLSFAQESTTTAAVANTRHPDASPLSDFFAVDSLAPDQRLFSEELLSKALQSEAFYTLVGQLKPVSEGFWSSYFDIERPDLSEIERVRLALKPWHSPNVFFADVIVYEAAQNGRRYASAYVVHLPSLKSLIDQNHDFFAKLGVKSSTPPSEILLTIERCSRPDDRWRGFGLIFGYPQYAIDFFVSAGLYQRETGEFVDRDFRQIPTPGSQSGRFVYAVPKLSPLRQVDIAFQRRSVALLEEYRRRQRDPANSKKNSMELLREWMDSGDGFCHPEHLISKIPKKSDAELDADFAKWTTPKKHPPRTLFSHLSVVLSQDAFATLRSSEWLTKRFAASDQGFPEFEEIDDDCEMIHLRGQDTYLTFLGPNNPNHHPIGKICLNWSVEKLGDLEVVQQLFNEPIPQDLTRTLKQFNDGTKESDWYYSLEHSSFIDPSVGWQFSEYHANFIPTLFPDRQADNIRIARRDFLDSRFNQERILKNITSLTVELPRATAIALRHDLEKVNWTFDQFDPRTWILKGPDFQLMIIVREKNATPRLSSIGFTTNADSSSMSPIKINNHIEIVLDGKGTGWIDWKTN